jgi:Dyp-type peroxidase family
MSPAPRLAPRVLRYERARVAVAAALALDEPSIAAARPTADADEEPVLAADDIQGNILPGFNTEHLVLLGLRIRATEEAAARQWLRELTPLITSLNDAFEAREVRRAVAMATGEAPPRPGVFLNIALSFDALAPLGLTSENIPAGPFRSGMPAANLGDPLDGTGMPIGWRVGATRDTTPHLLVILGADDGRALAEARDVLVAHTGPGLGLDPMYEDVGARLPGETEHFGFRDGVSQPGVRGRRTAHPDSFVTRRYIDAADPLALRFARPGQPLIWPGEFLFGYPVQDALEGPGPVAAPPESWMMNGAFLTFRRLRQDVGALERFAEREATAASTALGRPVTAAEVKAWLVGRWPDGEPLVRSPDGPPAPGTTNEFELNYYDYVDAVPATTVQTDGSALPVRGADGDDRGHRCPRFAHVRKVNLREKTTDRGPSSSFRVLRRGIPYAAEANDRGLLFLSYQRSVEQFMTLAVNWMNGQSGPEGDSGHDLLVGQPAGTRSGVREFADGRAASVSASEKERWVMPTGGGFFFAPARSVFAGLRE